MSFVIMGLGSSYHFTGFYDRSEGHLGRIAERSREAIHRELCHSTSFIDITQEFTFQSKMDMVSRVSQFLA